MVLRGLFEQVTGVGVSRLRVVPKGVGEPVSCTRCDVLCSLWACAGKQRGAVVCRLSEALWRGGLLMHQDIEFTHMIVRYDAVDLRLAVAVCYGTSLEEAEALLQVFIDQALCFAPTAMYAIRDINVACLYQKVL
jgi:hypothetical protein